ncbi:hypothetical protein SAMN05421505_10516 [Sinosporangium album]|uniref:Leucine Rich repeat-containing protein n=1 Tax=Sinosporangium album TaxID=504805 RepID=A0A1G7UX59_9ACTN|nr:STM4015 family protein [Sinosporangium album]SDG52185.1 hypothetical protein SAMN05421505_10516 [Sinosporangium album]
MIEHDPRHSYPHDYNDTYAGLPVASAPLPGDAPDRELPDAAAAAWRLEANTDDPGLDDKFEEVFARFLTRMDTARVTALLVGGWENSYEVDSSHVVRLFVENAERFPALRSLFFGAIPSEVAEISWIQQSDVTPLLKAFPALERLDVRGGGMPALQPIRHEALRMLRLESGGLGADVVRAVGECELPALEYLELWLGVEQYGGDAAVADLGAILSGERLPSLRHLGLQNGEIQDEVAAAVSAAPIVARIESLSLSMGVLTDTGAEALLSGQPLTHLRRLDLHHHFLTDSMIERVTDALPGVDVDLSDQEEPEDEWFYTAVSE